MHGRDAPIDVDAFAREPKDQSGASQPAVAVDPTAVLVAEVPGLAANRGELVGDAVAARDGDVTLALAAGARDHLVGVV